MRAADTERALQQWNAAEFDGSVWIAVPRKGFGFFESLRASAERRADSLKEEGCDASKPSPRWSGFEFFRTRVRQRSRDIDR